MRKNLMLFAILFVSTIVSYGQIRFADDYEEALASAKKYKKKIFIDIYTQWCGPCKEMAKNTFTQEKVGRFFNQNYISLKIDAEAGKGPDIAKKYGVNSYPTLVFLDSNGEFVHKISGALKADRLIAEAKKSMSPKDRELRALSDSYVAGNMKSEEIPNYLELLKEVKLPCNDVLDNYIVSLKEKDLISHNTYVFIRKYASGVDAKAFKVLVENHKKYAKVVESPDKFYSYLYGRYVFETYQNKRASKSNAPMYEFLTNSDIDFVPALKENYTLVVRLLKDKSKHSEVVTRAKKLLKEYPLASRSFLNEAVKQAVSSKLMAAYCEEAIHTFASWDKVGAASVTNSLAYMYLLNGRDHKTALKYYTLSTKWNPNITGYAKSNMEYCQRTLGLIKCENYGQIAPEFTLKDKNGKSVSLSDFKGKYVLLDFWASWCGPCKGELPYLHKANEKFKDVTIVSISIDKDVEAWEKAIQKDDMSWNQLIVNDSDIKKAYEIRGVPRIMLIGKDGKILADELRGESIEREIKKVL